MKLRTEITVPTSPLKIGYDTTILTLGSCFSEEIGHLLQTHKFNTLNNPFGTTFNPISIAEIIENFCSDKKQPALPCQLEEVYLDHRFHSSLYGYNEIDLNHKITQAFHQSKQQLQSPKPVLIITLGTAWIYRHLASNRIVSNCHKQDLKAFQKELGSVNLFMNAFQKTFGLLFESFPQTEIILTLSPVRHTKEGLTENQISKSILRVLCHELHSTYKQVHYFPAYEIIVDDLRDYRFYKNDLIHPNDEAINYIWSLFRRSYFEETTNTLVERWSQLQHQLLHKPFYEQSKGYLKFLHHTLNELQQLQHQLPLEEEIRAVEHKIKTFIPHA